MVKLDTPITVAEVLARIGATDRISNDYGSILDQDVYEYGFCTFENRADDPDHAPHVGEINTYAGGGAFFVMRGTFTNRYYLVVDSSEANAWEVKRRQLDPDVNAPGVIGPKPASRVRLVWS